MFGIRGDSGWKYDTGSSVSIGALYVGGGWGTLVLTSPTKSRAIFKYKHIGGGVGAGVNTVGELTGKGGDASFSGQSYPSAGRIYLLNAFKGHDLTYGDIEGLCIIVGLQVTAISVVGGSLTGMLLGIPAVHAKDEVESDLFHLAVVLGFGGAGQMTMKILDSQKWSQLKTYAKALLVMGGFGNNGAAAGVLGSVGYISAIPLTEDQIQVDQLPKSHEENQIRTSITSNLDAPIILPAEVLFAFAHYDLKPGADQTLEEAWKVIKTKPGRRLSISGYTDSVGPADYNVVLSNWRAKTVKQWFVSRGYLKDSEAGDIP